MIEKKDEAGIFIGITCDQYETGKEITDVIDEFLSRPEASTVESISIGNWGEAFERSSEEVVEYLVSVREKLPRLKSLFIGEIESEECEISWINQSDLSPLLEGFPRLEALRVRGSEMLRFSRLKHGSLKSLVIECGGLPKEVMEDITAGELPELERLELYLGEENYGFDGTLDDVRPLLEKGRFPKLKYLGLRNCRIADQVAAEVADAPVMEQLETLDLSLGTLGDEGAKALLKSGRVKKLKKLDLHFHYMTDEMIEKIKQLETQGVTVDVSHQQEAGEDDGEMCRYIAVSE